MSREKQSVSFCRSPQGKAEETGIEAKLRAHPLAPPEDQFFMWGKRPRRAFGSGSFLVVN